MRRYCKTLGPLAALPVVAAVIAQTCAAGTEDAIRGIVSRAQAIVSGRLTFVYSLTNYVGDRLLNSDTLPETVTSFSESSWAERHKGGPTILINHNGYFLDYAATPQPSGNTNFRVILQPPHDLKARLESNAPPIFAGCFWERAQLDYVKAHGSKSRSLGRETVNGIATEKLELDVPAEDNNAAYGVVIPDFERGGTIRLFVAPHLGYIMPRIELVTLDGAVVKSYDARDFAEVSRGVFFPKHIEENNYLAGGVRNRFHQEFNIRAELINEPIPEEDFIIQLPVGTSVHDGRDAEHVVAFFIKDPTASSALADLSVAAGGPAPPGFFHRWRNAILTGAVLGIVLATASFLVARRRGRTVPARR